MQKTYFGRLSYQMGVELQKDYRSKVLSDPKQIFVLGGEHEPVVTYGRRMSKVEVEAHPFLKTHGHWDCHQSSRGGLLTLHQPGQLVVYPVLQLKFHNLTVKAYIGLLLDCTVDLLRQYGIKAKAEKCGLVGVYTDAGKIGSIGVQISRGISQHGLSINVKNDLDPWQKFEICGVQGQRVDKMEQHCTALLSLPEVFDDFFHIFKRSI